MVNQVIHAPARARGYCPQHAEMSWRTTLTVLTVLTALTLVARFSTSPAYGADIGTSTVFVDEGSRNLIGWPFTFSPPLAEEPRRSIDHLLV